MSTKDSSPDKPSTAADMFAIIAEENDTTNVYSKE